MNFPHPRTQAFWGGQTKNCQGAGEQGSALSDWVALLSISASLSPTPCRRANEWRTPCACALEAALKFKSAERLGWRFLLFSGRREGAAAGVAAAGVAAMDPFTEVGRASVLRAGGESRGGSAGSRAALRLLSGFPKGCERPSVPFHLIAVEDRGVIHAGADGREALFHVRFCSLTGQACNDTSGIGWLE